ncbi:hypothetical protein BN77_2343 [Rhizobium mesoamericanum STM3625]|uniref:Uncharacterized protein n=1 Tax=Rhizobium mesoamericanum STM3625 TaxID=1211777 RepID=K0PUX0_9HYPH|nr:hypothetical protein BN77_2343 [Rhizobium mesoamericanum STM3625]
MECPVIPSAALDEPDQQVRPLGRLSAPSITWPSMVLAFLPANASIVAMFSSGDQHWNRLRLPIVQQSLAKMIQGSPLISMKLTVFLRAAAFVATAFTGSGVASLENVKV